jgi:hypothetical protein
MIPFFQGAASGAPAPGTVFATTLYTGNGSSQTVTTGIDLSTPGGLLWLKSRNAAFRHYLFDTVRGMDRDLSTNNTDAEGTGGLWSATTTGFSASGATNGNQNTTTFASWSFARSARFFDVVTYTGNGANRTIAHSLGTTPGLIIVKRRDGGGWRAYHRSLSNTEFVSLNTTSGASSATDYWNSTTATSSVFSVGTNSDVNFYGGEYVAYLFAHDTASDGIVQCGSFTTDASGNATVTLGWQPQFLLAKPSSGTGSWQMLDTARGWASGSDATLQANTSSAEGSLDNGAPTGTGFTYANGLTSGTHIYLAIRSA